MDSYTVSHLSNRALLHDLKTSVATERTSVAVALSRIAEVDERRLFLEEGYASMYAFCVHELHYSEGAAYKRITAARVARRFPVIFVALAEGRLHLSGVVMLSKYLRSGNLDELLDAVTHKTKAEIGQLIAERFPRPDVPERLQVIAPPAPVPAMTAAGGSQLSPGTVQATMPSSARPAPVPAIQLSPGTDVPPTAPARMTPLAPQRYAFQCMFDQETHDLLQDVRALMSHEVPLGETALVLKGALKLAKAELLKRKAAATDRPGPARPSASARHIPAAVRRAVWDRDGARCSFVSESGRRCEERAWLEYDHIEPVACGGKAIVENLRLLCRAHNQHAAERAFGTEFMERKRA